MLALGHEMAELCPRRVAPELHEPDGDALPARLPGHADEAASSGSATRCRRPSRDLAELVGVPQERGHVPLGRASTTRRSCCASSTTASRSIRASTSGSRADPELQRRVRVALYRRFGYFQTESSEHAAEYVPWFMRHDDELERYRVPVDEYITRSEDNLIEFAAGQGGARAPASRCRSSARASTPPRSSTRWSPASRA